VFPGGVRWSVEDDTLLERVKKVLREAIEVFFESSLIEQCLRLCT
jgi:hypothetical protein